MTQFDQAQARSSMLALSGLLNLDKPSGVTSRDVVDRVSRPLRKVKVGHAGTLDPLASGVLVICVGSATRLIEYVQQMPKTYVATIRLGATSDTLDADGQVVDRIAPPIPSEQEVRSSLMTQVGTIQQLPPQFSALKVGGKRAYDLARAGETVELKARAIEVYQIELVEYQWPYLRIRIDCGSGTYIRSIARDVGDILGCGGLIEVLTRTKIGPFSQADGIDPQTLTLETIPGLLRPAIEAVAALPRVILSAEERERITRGQTIEARDSIASGEVALIGPMQELVAIADVNTSLRKIAPKRLLVAAVGGKILTGPDFPVN
jgi:tRNA pseudouridine55 synthase